MMRQNKNMQNWTSRIANATPGELIGITYELIQDTIEQARSYLKESNHKGFERSMDQAQRFLRELMESLDMSFEISFDLMSMYLYMNKLLIIAVIKKEEEPLLETKKLLDILLVGWKEAAAAEDKSKGPVMENAQKVYAGLTYGKGTLNESILEKDNKRGFKA